MLSLSSILVFSDDPRRLTEFYSKIFEKEPEWDQEGYTGFMAGNVSLTIGPHDKVKGRNSNPERIMMNLETLDVGQEFKRIKELGAKVVAEPYQVDDEGNAWIATFEDPDGNIFQLVTPWE